MERINKYVKYDNNADFIFCNLFYLLKKKKDNNSNKKKTTTNMRICVEIYIKSN